MSNEFKVRDLLVAVEDHPRIPHTFTVGEALAEIKKYIDKGFYHILVFDEKFQLVSVFALRDLLRAMMPEHLRHASPPGYEGYAVSNNAELVFLWGSAFFDECAKMSKKSLSEILIPVKTTVNADAPVAEALYLMLQDNVNVLPVLEGSLVCGVIRLATIVEKCCIFVNPPEERRP